VLAGPAAYPVVSAERGAGILTALAAAGVAALLTAAVLRVAELVPAGIILVAGEYAAFLLLEHETLDPAAPLVAAALVLAAELGHSALEPPLVRAGPGLAARRGARLAGRTAAAAAIAVLVLAVSVTEIRSGLAVELVGIAAAVAALGLVALLARRTANVKNL
jgi:hypothetical protein